MHSRWAVVLGALGLVLVYVFQLQLFYDPFQAFQPDGEFISAPQVDVIPYITAKVVRYMLNDGFALLIIWGLFGNKRYMRFAVIIFLIGLFVLLPLYLVMSLNFYASAYAFLNHLHRLVLNPVLMMLLIPAFYYQKSLSEQKK